MRLPGLLAVIVLLPLVAFSQSRPVITVQGVDGATVSLSADDLAKLPQASITATEHGKPAAFRGVLLSDVLNKVAVPAGQQFHSSMVSYYVVVEASDGYKAVFAWPEVDPGFNGRKIYVATARDGKPLSDREGPFCTVVPEDKKAGRWVRQVTAVRIKQAT